MNCEQARHLFDAYLDSDLSGALATELGAHKLNCAACRRELAILEVAGHVIATDSDASSLDDDFTERLLACALQPRPRWYCNRRTVGIAAAGLAAAACLVFGCMQFFGQGSASPDKSAPTMVAGAEVHATPEQLRQYVAEILARDPDNAAARRLAERLDFEKRRLVENTIDGANKLENLGKRTIMDLLDMIEVDLPSQPAGDEPSPPADPLEREHGSPRD